MYCSLANILGQFSTMGYHFDCRVIPDAKHALLSLIGSFFIFLRCSKVRQPMVTIVTTVWPTRRYTCKFEYRYSIFYWQLVSNMPYSNLAVTDRHRCSSSSNLNSHVQCYTSAKLEAFPDKHTSWSRNSLGSAINEIYWSPSQQQHK